MTSSITRRSTRRSKNLEKTEPSNEMEVETGAGEEKKMKLVKLEPDPVPATHLVGEEQGTINIQQSWLLFPSKPSYVHNFDDFD